MSANDIPWAERGAAFLRHLETVAEKLLPPGSETGDTASDSASKVEIILGPDEYRVTAAAAAALANETDIFRRDTTIVVLVPGDDGEWTIRPMPKPAIRDRLTRIVSLKEWRGKGAHAALVAGHPPKWLIDNLFERTTDYRGIRPIQRIVNHPLLLPDGSVLSEPGYHADTGTLMVGGCRASIPDRPTRADAERAAFELLDLVCDFPFATETDRSGWLAAALTPFAHAAYDGPAPLFWINKNSPGAGGTKQIHLISNLTDGRDAAISTYIHDVPEMRKQLTAWAIESPEMVVFDNVAGPFGSAPLSAAITGTVYKDRMLGVSATFQGKLRPVWYASSNNSQLVGDMHRRVLPIRLETHLDRPEERTDFKYPDLIGHVRANRGRYVSAALTVLRAWHLAGRPTHRLTPFDFRDWSGTVREAVVFATGIDPAACRLETANTADPERESILTVIECWPHLDPHGRGLFASAVADQIRQARDTTTKQPDWMLALIEAGESLGGRDISAERLGYAFRKYHRQRFDGRHLENVGKTHGKTRWGVRTVEPSRGDMGAMGDIPTPPHERKVSVSYLAHEEGSGDLPRVTHRTPSHTAPRGSTPTAGPVSADDLARLLRAADTNWEVFRDHPAVIALDEYLPVHLADLTPNVRQRLADLLSAPPASLSKAT